MTTIILTAIACVFLAQDPLRVVPGEAPRTRTIYRASKPGEERIEGLLRRIECPSGRPVTFILQKADKTPVKYSAPTLTSVEYIAHTPTFRGPVSCGGRTPPERVYVTYMSASKRVIAVEFLPPRER